MLCTASTLVKKLTKYNFMKHNFTRFVSLLLCIVLYQNVTIAQSAGDFRSNVSPTGLWNDVNSWQMYNGTSWGTAPHAPTSADGVITILASDSIRLSDVRTIDNVVVDNNGVLAIFNTSAFSVTVNDPITVNGRLYVANNVNLTGSGSILVNTGGTLNAWNGGTISVNVINNGHTRVQSAAHFANSSFTNNNSAEWASGTIDLSNASFINNGSFLITTTASTNINNPGATSTFTNSATGTITKQGSNNSVFFPAFSNTGRITGNGTILFANVTANTGTISPGNSPGILNLTNILLNNRPTTFEIELSTTGGVAGTNYDQVVFTSTPAAGSVNLNNAFLNVTNTASDPVGTIYTILTYPTPAGSTITGTIPPANITKPSNFTVNYSATAITLEKTAMFPLPVVWKSFEATAKNNQIEISWETSSEENASHFVVEHSAGNNIQYAPITSVQAKGNSNSVTKYKYIFTGADKNKTNYFRINQVDLDGKSKYSDVRFVKFDQGAVIKISTYPNPVKNELNINTQVNNIGVSLSDMFGRTILTKQLQAGTDVLNMHQLAKGYYLLSFYEEGRLIETQKVIKQ